MIPEFALIMLIGILLQGCLSSPEPQNHVDPSKCLGPAYPKEALAEKEEGTVTMDLLISTTGYVKESKILTSSGYTGLDQAALDGLSKCHFKPMTYYNGTPMEGWKTMQYVWKVNHNKDD